MIQTAFYQIQSIRIPQVNLTDTVIIKPPYIHFRRKANEYILYYVLSGEMHLMEGEELYVLKQNDMIILDPSHEHYGTKSTICNFIYIHFNIEDMREFRHSTQEHKNLLLLQRINTLNSHPTSSVLNSSENPRAQIDAVSAYMADEMAHVDAERTHVEDGYKELIDVSDFNKDGMIIPKYYHIRDTSSAIEIIRRLDKLQEIHKTILDYKQIQAGCLLIELLITLSREYITDFFNQNNVSSSKSNRTVYDIITFLGNSYSMDITGSLLEDKFNCNFDYINRIFKSMLGKTIFTYLNGLRIEKAKQFLSTHIYSLSDVAEKTGFHDVYYFSKVFKKYAGITPGAYIKQIS